MQYPLDEVKAIDLLALGLWLRVIIARIFAQKCVGLIFAPVFGNP